MGEIAGRPIIKWPDNKFGYMVGMTKQSISRGECRISVDSSKVILSIKSTSTKVCFA